MFVRLLISTLFLVQVSYAAGTDAFHQRFQLIKNEGKTISIKDKSLSFSFSIAPYVKFIKEKLKYEQSLMNSKADYEYELEELFADDFYQEGEKNNQNLRYVVESMRELKKLDIDKVFNSEGFKKVINKFESRIGDALANLDPSILAKADNPTFFYKRHVTYQVVKWGLDLAKKYLSHIPVLNTASYVIVQVEKLVRERRLFHQNMLMHYLENFPAEDLGLTHEEANLVWSSIYESRIPWFAFWESKTAVNTWKKYGTSKFFQSIRTANNRLRSNRGNFNVLGKRLNYAFMEAEYKGEEVIVNLYDAQDMFKSFPAIAHYINAPQKIARKRMILQLAQLGMSFLTIPDFVKSIAGSYLKSHYESQKLTEGALYGYFETVNNLEGKEMIRGQYLNPFDPLKEL